MENAFLDETIAQDEANFKELRTLLAPRFKRIEGFTLSDFMGVEALLTVVLEVGGADYPANKADRLLGNYSLLRPETFGPHEHLMQMARRHMTELASSALWKQRLGAYMLSDFDDLRFFNIEDDRVALAEDPFGKVDRRPAYREFLLRPMAPVGTLRSFCKAGDTYRYECRPEVPEGETRADAALRDVRIPKVAALDESTVAKMTEGWSEHKGQRASITVSRDELIAAGETLDAATGKQYRAAWLRRVFDQGLLKKVQGSDMDPTQEMQIDKVVNLVGLVGSGKSVLATALIVALTRKGYRVLSLLNSVADVMGDVASLRAAGVAASPLVAKGKRLRRLSESFAQTGSMFVEDTAARYLETPCLLDGLSMNDSMTCTYGETPCFSLQRVSKNGFADGPRYTCPFWGVCPSQAMVREALDSDAVISTPNGFTAMRVGAPRFSFFELVLARFDVVLFDEADRVQMGLDNFFAPKISMQELIYQAGNPTAVAMKRDPSDKLRDLNEEHFFDMRQDMEPVVKSLLISLRSEEVASWDVVKNEAFTSLALLNSLKESDDPLPERIAADLEKFIAYADDVDPKLSRALDSSCKGVSSHDICGEKSSFTKDFDEYLSSKSAANLSSCLRARLDFLIRVMYFDRFLRKLAESFEQLSYRDDSLSELHQFLKFSYVRQQRYLPSSLIGNIFGMKMTEENDLILFRQFAYGRAFMRALPWLDTDVDGNPTGPHVLMLSGSSYFPKCRQYHVNAPVDYLLEAPCDVAKKLRETTMKDLGITVRVSGSNPKERPEHLEELLTKLSHDLCREFERNLTGKALLIVNSYREAEAARDHLEQQLRRRGRTEKVCALYQAVPEDGAKFIHRSDLSRFWKHPARVLIAPALAIERGYNIVDEKGHSVFSSLFFCVRPMGLPHDLNMRCKRMNGFMEEAAQKSTASSAEFCQQVRGDSWALWKKLEYAERMYPGMMCDGYEDVRMDITATLAGLLVQVFGRLARITDFEREAPHVYFADAAFRGSDDPKSQAYRSFDELRRYFKSLMEDEEGAAVAHALYGPFYEAMERGVR